MIELKQTIFEFNYILRLTFINVNNNQESAYWIELNIWLGRFPTQS
jgi:hypothetical protein